MARLYERYARVVHGILLAHVPFSDAEDLAQEVFLVAMKSIHSLRDPGAFGGWLAATARNHAAAWARKQRLQRKLPIASIAHSESRHQELGIEEVMSAISRLGKTYRETLILRLVEGLTGPEIAERTGMKHGSVRVNLHRGMELLRKELGGALP